MSAPEPGHSCLLDPGHNRIKVLEEKLFDLALVSLRGLSIPTDVNPGSLLSTEIHGHYDAFVSEGGG